MSWLLLRGLIREQRHWGSFPAAMQAAFPQQRILTPDLPGNGSLYQQASPTSIIGMVEYLRGWLDQQQVQQPVRILALSLGAMVAVAWAERYPQELASLVLINTSLAPHNRFYQRLRPANYPRLLASMLAGPVSAKENCILQLTSRNPVLSRQQLLDSWVRYAAEAPVSRSNALRQLLAALSYRAPAQFPAVPALLLNGAADQLVNPCCSEQLAARWQLPLACHPEAGHDLPLDAPDWVIAQVLQWLDSRALPSARSF